MLDTKEQTLLKFVRLDAVMYARCTLDSKDKNKTRAILLLRRCGYFKSEMRLTRFT